MNTKIETQGSRLDPVKLIAALVIITAAVGAFYYYAEQPLLYRALGIVIAGAVSVTIVLQTERGRGFIDYFQEALVEVRKVFWPSRQETVRTTLAVLAMVLVVALFLWLLDSFLGWIMRLVTGVGA
ncbi:MAG: preprotein translocase subunit SecE [Gammaproteobacteria bacterium]